MASDQAIYHLTSGVGRRKAGQSAAAKSEYLARQGRYRRGADEVRHVESGQMPAWAYAGRGADRGARYWRQADELERSNAVLFRQVEAALPRALDEQQQLELARELAAEAASSDAGPLPYTFAIHDSGGNPHVHIMLSEHVADGHDRDPETWFRRANKKTPEAGGSPKAQIGEYRSRWLAQVRERWSELANGALERAGSSARIDHRSLVEQGVDRLPQRHFGAQARAIEERTGERTIRGDLYRARQYAIEQPHDSIVRGAYSRALEKQQLPVKIKGRGREPRAPADLERNARQLDEHVQSLESDRAEAQTALDDTSRLKPRARKRAAGTLEQLGERLEQLQQKLQRMKDHAEKLRERLRRDPGAVRRTAAAADEIIAPKLAQRADGLHGMQEGQRSGPEPSADTGPDRGPEPSSDPDPDPAPDRDPDDEPGPRM